MAPRLRSAGRSSTNDSSNGGGNGDSENSSRPASIKSSPPSAKKAAAQGGRSDDESDEASPLLPGDEDDTAAEEKPSSSKDDREDDDRVSLPASSFERAAHRASRKGKAMGPSSSSRLSSEYDSEDIVVAPRHSQRETTEVKDTPQTHSSTTGDGDLKAPESSSPRPRSSASSGGDPKAPASSSPPKSSNTNSKDRRKPNGSSSDLSDLGSTPEPVDPELVRLAGEERRRKLGLCECEGWCTCERYKIFYGFGPLDEDSDAGAGLSAKDNDKAVSTAKRKRAANSEPEANDRAVPPAKRKRAATTDTDYNDEVGAAIERKRAATADIQNEDFENDFGFSSSSQSKDSSDSSNTSHDAAEESDFELPSQTHLSERVLANEQFPDSAMRSTLNSGKRRNDFDNERAATHAEQIYSWDHVDKPMRPPAGWVGGEWVGGRGKGKARMK